MVLTVNELFSGIGTQSLALKYAGIPHKTVGIAEISKPAITAYMSLHGETRNYGDVSLIDTLDYADLWTYSFPCQDLSQAGKRAGIGIEVNEAGKIVNKSTRSGLLWQVERLLDAAVNGEVKTPPKYLMLENVPELIRVAKNRENFDKWRERLDELGYYTTWQVYNSANFGVPQGRERVFCVSIRKDLPQFEFLPSFIPYEVPLLNMGDFLDAEVHAYDGPFRIDSVYTERMASVFMQHKEGIESCARTLKQNVYRCPVKSGYQDFQIGIVYAPTLRHQNTMTTVYFNNQVHKLTAHETWRFMGIKSEDFWKVKNETNLGDNTLMGLAGNAIVVTVMQHIFRELLKDYII